MTNYVQPVFLAGAAKKILGLSPGCQTIKENNQSAMFMISSTFRDRSNSLVKSEWDGMGRCPSNYFVLNIRVSQVFEPNSRETGWEPLTTGPSSKLVRMDPKFQYAMIHALELEMLVVKQLNKWQHTVMFLATH
jgi:hypothetical protein